MAASLPNIIIALLFWFVGWGSAFGESSLRIDPAESSDGKVTITYPAGADEVVLQQSDSPDFANPTVRYRGDDPSTVLTGLAEGSHYFRIRHSGTEWSEPVKTEVRFMSRPQLALLFLTGFLVTAATIGAIFAGNGKSASPAP